MNIVIFGNSRFPDISFTLSPSAGLQISCRNNYVTVFPQRSKKISWWDLFERTSPRLADFSYSSTLWRVGKPPAHIDIREIIQSLKLCRASLEELCASPAEKTLFRLYWDYFFTLLGDRDPFEELKTQGIFPALIPQVWVNWLHYDSSDRARSMLMKRQPFRVDFAVFTEDRRLILEVDGSSHFGAPAPIDERGTVHLDADMASYTEHLRKDRWLRRQGWEVFRFSNKEIEEMSQIEDLLDEVGLLVEVPF